MASDARQYPPAAEVSISRHPRGGLKIGSGLQRSILIKLNLLFNTELVHVNLNSPHHSFAWCEEHSLPGRVNQSEFWTRLIIIARTLGVV